MARPFSPLGSPGVRKRLTQGLSLAVLLFFALLASVPDASAQVTIAPTGLFLDESSPHESLSITNSSDRAQEVTLSMKFGYPAPQPNGHLAIRYEAGGPLSEYDLSPYLRLYPKRFLLAPGARQTVRIFTPSGSSDLTDGTYFTRLIVEARPQMASSSDASFAQVSFGVRQSAAIMMRLGARQELRPGISTVRSEKRRLMVRVGSRSKEPYWGRLSLSLSGEGGREVFSTKRSVAAYVPTTFRFSVPDDLPPGRYEANVRLSPDRPDIPATHRTLGPIVERVSPVTIEALPIKQTAPREGSEAEESNAATGQSSRGN